MDSSDVTGLVETGIGLGATLLFTGMMINATQNMTNNLIKKGKKVDFFSYPSPNKPSTTKNLKKRKR